MTLSDFYCTLLVTGLNVAGFEEREIKPDGSITISINNEELPFFVDLSRPALWRYKTTQPYDLGVNILKEGRVLVLYESAIPNESTWEHHHIFDKPNEAWGFIQDFLQKHPDK